MAAVRDPGTEFHFETEVIEWRGPSPFFFTPVPAIHVADIADAARRVSYGWGVIPVTAKIGEITFTTSLFPKDGGYLLPLKDAVRRKAAITVGDTIAVTMAIGSRH